MTDDQANDDPDAYMAICRQVGDWWEIAVPELPAGRITQARSLDDADATVRDLVGLITGDDPESIKVHVVVQATEGER